MTEFDKTAKFWVGPANAPDTFELVSMLGGGGEGEVWRGVLPLSEGGRRSVAVKIARAPGFDDSERWERFGHLLRSLSHPGLVRVTDVFAGPGMHRAGEIGVGEYRYVVMDYVEGVSLADWAAENPGVPVSLRLRMLRMIAAALDDMHAGATTEVPVAHGDVKPANIVVSADHAAVLVDLGLARLADAGGISGHSVPYAAPELRVAGALPSPDADRWAFAVTTAQTLIGMPPPLGRDGWLDADALRAQLKRHPMTERRHVLIEEIMAVVAAPPEARPRSLRRWLDGAVESLSQLTGPFPVPKVAATEVGVAGPFERSQYPPVVPDPEPVAGVRPRRRSRGFLAAAVVLVFVAAGAVAMTWPQFVSAQVAASASDITSAPAASPSPSPVPTVAAAVLPASGAAPALVTVHTRPTGGGGSGSGYGSGSGGGSGGGGDPIDPTDEPTPSPSPSPTPPPLEIVTESLPTATVGQAWSAPLSAQGGVGRDTWTLVKAPTFIGLTEFGLVERPTPGHAVVIENGAELSGTPTDPGHFPITVRVTDAAGRSATATLPFTALQILHGDLNGDGQIDCTDLAILKANFGKTDQGPEDGDLDGNGTVDIHDLSILLSNFGKTRDGSPPTGNTSCPQD